MCCFVRLATLLNVFKSVPVPIIVGNIEQQNIPTFHQSMAVPGRCQSMSINSILHVKSISKTITTQFDGYILGSNTGMFLLHKPEVSVSFMHTPIGRFGSYLDFFGAEDCEFLCLLFSAVVVHLIVRHSFFA